ncbi:hypothetical protein [Bradyrhizobium sp. USDA 3364]
MSITQDGSKFTTVQPWAGFSAPNGGGSSSNVAYLNVGTAENPVDRYVMTGTTLVTEDVTVPAEVISEDPAGLGCNDGYTETVFDTNFAWATSSNGFSWSTGYSPAVYEGIAGSAGSAGPTIAAGNGVFVAGAGRKKSFAEAEPVVFSCCVDYGPPVGGHCNILQATRPEFVLNSAAVAVSRDGRTWQTVALPGAEVSSSVDGDTASNGNLVVFIKHRQKPPKKGITGFFIATSQTGGPHPHGRIYKSEDGFSWELIGSTNDRLYQYLSAIAETLRNTESV